LISSGVEPEEDQGVEIIDESLIEAIELGPSGQASISRWAAAQWRARWRLGRVNEGRGREAVRKHTIDLSHFSRPLKRRGTGKSSLWSPVATFNPMPWAKLSGQTLTNDDIVAVSAYIASLEP
jgi:hypothetical protein